MRAFHCPGHTTDHMAFVLEEENAMFTGDNVLGHGTAVFEDLAVYLDSLSRMREQFHGRAYPGHVGPSQTVHFSLLARKPSRSRRLGRRKRFLVFLAFTKR